jgi:hypothetical protein
MNAKLALASAKASHVKIEGKEGNQREILGLTFFPLF